MVTARASPVTHGNTVSFLGACLTGPHAFFGITGEAATGGEMAGLVCCCVFWEVEPPSAAAVSAPAHSCHPDGHPRGRRPPHLVGEATEALMQLTFTTSRCQGGDHHVCCAEMLS